MVEFAGGTHSLGGTTLNGTGKAEGDYTVDTGTTFTINGTYSWQSSSISGPGQTTIAPGGKLVAPGDSSSRFLDTGTLRIDGSAEWTGTSTTYIQDGATIEVGSGGTLDSKANHAFSLNTGTGISTCSQAGR